ncbi:DUF29 domain-containing protein [Roseicella aquatilis]|uniref:DUF29 domain-containing protein n=1 Tax=Roseicella aquatilis TaxID=2527868 RepID=A0A4R4D6H1_9PROT|nr:DUF29 domain-containing protein [Roseicella aquatilis]TCZ55587.1 DUF29 domain-containing protein [Roseicella aquatilis]
MDQSALYDEDVHAWALHQARVLRGLATAGLRLPNDLDLEHVAEEIEDLGNEQRFQVESNLGQALAHLIKIVALPEDQAVRHWAREARAFLRTAARRYRPSMRRAVEPAKIWAWACRDAADDLGADGHTVPALPREMPVALEDLVSEEADARALAARLADMLRAPPRT